MTLWKIMALAALAAPIPAAAHEVWVERDASGPARIYLGEPNEAVPDAGDPEFPRLKAPKVSQGTNKAVATVRRGNHIEAALPGGGDVRVQDDAIFDPWKSREGMQAVVFYARAGRSEAAEALDFEFVPVAPSADRFSLRFRGQPVPDSHVTIIAPGYWQKTFTSDAKGEVEVPQKGDGRYLLSASHTENAEKKVGDVAVSSVIHTTTLTFSR